MNWKYRAYSVERGPYVEVSRGGRKKGSQEICVSIIPTLIH